MSSYLVIVAQIDTVSGYGQNSILKAQSLMDAGYEVFIRSSNTYSTDTNPIPYRIFERLVHVQGAYDWELVIQPPGFCLTPGKKAVWATTLEATGVSKQALAQYGLAEAIIVPSQWNKETLLKLGLKKPIYVVPEPYNEEVFGYRQPVKRPVFVFGTAGNTTYRDGQRKGFVDVIKAFKLAFPEDGGVRLEIKMNGAEKLEFRDSRIKVIADMLSPKGLADWYAGLDVFVSASRGEGWGRMLYEAMATGRASIATFYGGHREFWDSSYGWPVAYEEEQGKDRYAEGQWALPDVAGMAKQMRFARENPAICQVLGRAAGFHVQRVNAKADKELESVLLDVGAIRKPKPRLVKQTPEDYIVGFYDNLPKVPKMTVPEAYLKRNLTNTPLGIGDSLVLSVIPRLAEAEGRPHGIFHIAPHFGELSSFIASYKATPATNAIAADRLQRLYDLGPGHFMQRLQRGLGYVPDAVPKAAIVCPGEKVKGRVAVHLVPGRHSVWQRQFIHPLARQVYSSNLDVLAEFAKERSDLQLVEIGQVQAGRGLEDYTKKTLSETIRFLATCEYFIGIVSGPLHLATALDCKCVVILNFPAPEQVVLPNLKDVAIVELDWIPPQATCLHQDGSSFLVPRFSLDGLHKAINGETYPFWSERYLSLTT